MIKVLRQRDFALLWLGGLISLAGDWVLLIGLPIYIFLLTRSVLATGLMLLAGRVPAILFGSVAGVFVDRWDRKRTMVVANVLLAVALLPLVLVHSVDRVWIVYLISAVESLLEQFVTPAQNALIPALVKEEQLVAANSLNSLASNLARLCGPALGGVIAALWGLGGIVLGDAVSFALAALLIAGISARHARLADAAPGDSMPGRRGGSLIRLGREWAGGIRVIFSERVLAVLFLAFAITNLGEGVMGTLYPVFVNRVLHGVALQIGELMSAQAVGGLLGGLLAGWLGERLLSKWMLGISAVLFGLLDLAIFNAPALLPTLVPVSPLPIFAFEAGLFVAVGVPGIWMLSGALSRVQASAPDAYRGRVFGVLGVVMSLLNVVGIVVASTLTAHLGVVTMLNIQGSGYIAAGLLMLWLLPRRRRESVTPATVGEPVVSAPMVPAPYTVGDRK
jgi:MFS family permease